MVYYAIQNNFFDTMLFMIMCCMAVFSPHKHDGIRFLCAILVSLIFFVVICIEFCFYLSLQLHCTDNLCVIAGAW